MKVKVIVSMVEIFKRNGVLTSVNVDKQWFVSETEFSVDASDGYFSDIVASQFGRMSIDAELSNYDVPCEFQCREVTHSYLHNDDGTCYELPLDVYSFVHRGMSNGYDVQYLFVPEVVWA